MKQTTDDATEERQKSYRKPFSRRNPEMLHRSVRPSLRCVMSSTRASSTFSTDATAFHGLAPKDIDGNTFSFDELKGKVRFGRGCQ